MGQPAGRSRGFLPGCILRLTLLAPDLIEATLEGVDLEGLPLEKLHRAQAGWEEQRRVLAWELDL
jgi:hypothetical protein